MRFVILAFLSCLSVFAVPPAKLALPKVLDTAPLRFEPNSGLHKRAAEIRWTARGLGYAFLFTDDATVIHAGGRYVKLNFPGANRKAKFEGRRQLAVSTNYFVGKKYASVPAFERLHRSGIYPGIDLVYYGNGREIEYDFEIAAGADPSQISMRFDGADGIRLSDRGDIVLALGAAEMIQRPPVVYQRRESGEVVGVHAEYQLESSGATRLKLGEYDRRNALIVDPTIAYAAYLQGTSTDTVAAIAHDAQGRIYLAGSTYSVDFPATTDADQSTNLGAQDAWVMQLDPTAGANAIVYCTYLGGVGIETVKAMVIDQNNIIYITGSTNGDDFPVTAGALQNTISGNSHAFVSMIDPSQSGTAGLLYSTFIAGSQFEEGDGIAVANGKIYVTGWTTSDDFPVAASYQTTRAGSYDAFVMEIDPSQSGTASEIAATYLGGTGQDLPRSIAVDGAGRVYITGITYSFDFPTTTNAYDSVYRAGGDVFIAELDLGAATLNYSTYFGGSSIDDAKKILLTPAGNVALAGLTLSADFPVTQNAYQTKFGGNGNAFVSILNLSRGPSGLVYSTYFGGTGGEAAYDMRLDAFGRYYFGGYTLSSDLPVTPDALNPTSASGNIDGFIAVLDPSAGLGGLVYSSYITGPGLQTVYGIDVVNPPSGSTGAPAARPRLEDAHASPTVQIAVTGTATSNIFAGATPPDIDIGKSATFLLLIQLTAPASTGTVGAAVPEHSNIH
jgi:hypothetical protein